MGHYDFFVNVIADRDYLYPAALGMIQGFVISDSTAESKVANIKEVIEALDKARKELEAQNV